MTPCVCPAHVAPCHRKRRPHRRLCSSCIDACAVMFVPGGDPRRRVRGHWVVA